MTKEQKWLNTITDFNVADWAANNSELSISMPKDGQRCIFRVDENMVINRFNQMKEEIAINAIDKFIQAIKDCGELSGADIKHLETYKQELLDG